MIRSVFILHICLFISLTIISCKEKDGKVLECGNGNTVLFPSDAFERFYFKDSTYWIYKDSLSGQIDSAWVQNSKALIAGIQTSDEESKSKCFQFGEYSINSFLGLKYQVNLFPRGKFQGDNFSDIYILINNPGINLTFSSIKDSVYRNDGLSDGNIFFMPNIIVNGIEFNNVLQWNNTTSTPIFFARAYYIRNVGLVKYISSNGRIWELIRYRIK